LIPRKISNTDAIRYQILRLKCSKFDFRRGSAPDPAGELAVLSQTLDLFKGLPQQKGRGRGGKGRRVAHLQFGTLGPVEDKRGG